jgi:hypothetical protein
MDEFDRVFIQVAIDEGWFRYDWIEVTLPSGRKFRYQLKDFPFRVDASEAEISALAYRIAREKYRYCQWDRSHHAIDSEADICASIKNWMLGQVAEAKMLKDGLEVDTGREQQGKTSAFIKWGIFSDCKLVEEFPYRERSTAERRLEELLAQAPGKYYLQQIKRTQESEGNR